MKRFLSLLSTIVIFLLTCTACDKTAPTQPSTATTPSATVPTQASATTIETTTTTPVPAHSPLFIDGLAVEDVVTFFNEVCLDAEFVTAGNPTVVQKWVAPITYRIFGECTEEDRRVLQTFTEYLNTIDGFPGIFEAQEDDFVNLRIHFGDQQLIPDLMGKTYTGMDGAVEFFYNSFNEINEGTIVYRNDIDQEVRNSVILEEIYNGLGPIQDTALRDDSIIYAGFSTPQQLTAVDELLIKLLYHPSIQCGMNATECEQVIRTLYY